MILAIYGDSISTSEFGNGGYPKKLEKALNLEKVYNYAVCAACLADTRENNGISVIKNPKNRHSDADVVILWHGTNDWYFGNPIGDENTMSEDSFCGALLTAINLLRETNPDVKIILPTPILRYQAPDGSDVVGEALDTPNRAGFTQAEYTKAIKKIGVSNGCTVIDMREKTGFSIETMSKYLQDCVHPSEEGCEIISVIFTQAIKKIM